MPSEIGRLLTEVERSLHGEAWHGPSVTEALRGIPLAEAIARPIAGANTIAELTWHIAAWIEEVASRLRGTAPSEPERGNFPESEPADEAEWESWKNLPGSAFEELKLSARAFPAERLHQAVPQQSEGERVPTYWETVNGVAQHNTYHAGQIVLLKRSLRTES